VVASIVERFCLVATCRFWAHFEYLGGWGRRKKFHKICTEAIPKYQWSWLVAYQTRQEAQCRVPWENITLLCHCRHLPTQWTESRCATIGWVTSSRHTCYGWTAWTCREARQRVVCQRNMGTHPVRCWPLCSWTRLCLPYCCTDAHSRLTVRHPNSCYSCPTALGGSGLALAVLLLGYPAVQGESGLVPTPLALGKG
jgi:hypothetical protein